MNEYSNLFSTTEHNTPDGWGSINCEWDFSELVHVICNGNFHKDLPLNLVVEDFYKGHAKIYLEDISGNKLAVLQHNIDPIDSHRYFKFGCDYILQNNRFMIHVPLFTLA